MKDSMTHSGNRLKEMTNREFPTSIYQKRFWDEWRRAPTSVAYNIPSVFEIDGELDVAAMRRAVIDFVACRQEVCRTCFFERDGELRQVLLANPEPDFHYEEAGDDVPQATVDAFVRRYSHYVYDLTTAPLYKIGLLRHGQHRYTLVISFHHAISDGISYQDYTRALSELYNQHRSGVALPITPPVPGFEDYVTFEQEAYSEEDRKIDLEYWEKLLGESKLSIELPQKTHARIDNNEGRFIYFKLDAQTSELLRQRAKASGTTLFRLISVLYAVLLSRFGNQDSVVISHTVNLRPKQFRHLIGCFMNNVPLAFHVGPQATFSEIIAAANRQRDASRAHQRCSLTDIVEHVRRLRGHMTAEVLNIGLNESPGWLREVPLQLDGAICRGVPPKECESIYDLSMAYENRPEITFRIDHKINLIDPTVVDSMVRHFRTLVQAVIDDPDAQVYSVIDEKSLLPNVPTNKPFALHLTVDELISAQVARRPSAIAATEGRVNLTYQQLWDCAGRLAEKLRGERSVVGPALNVGDRIAVCMDRGLDLLVTLIAVWRLGCAYVPLDPEQPKDRLLTIVEDAGVRLVLVGDSQTEGCFSAGLAYRTDGVASPISNTTPAPTELLPGDRSCGDLAYLIYTSGSTGKPKGVEVTHRNAVNFLLSMALQPGLAETDAILAVTTVCFDISILELFLPLTVGARTIIASAEDCRDATRLTRLIADSGATMMQATPATWKLLLAAEWKGAPYLTALCGGEALDSGLAAALLSRVGSLWNLYGPTETTIWSTISRVIDPARISLGEPIANTRLHILDHRGHLALQGVAGELLIAGEGVARGYRNRPELTADKFVPDPICPTRRAFRTGDLVRRDDDGTLVYLGRIDTQLKIRGYRVELGEIESVLRALPNITDAVVVARREQGAVTALWGFIVPKDPMDDDAARRLKIPLGERLPSYMVPGRLIVLPALPLTANGKVNRKALTEEPLEHILEQTSRASAAKPVRKSLALTQDGLLPELRTLVADLLERSAADIGVDEPLGELGFDSIRFTALATRLNKVFQINVSPALFYTFSTVRSLADHLLDVVHGTVAKDKTAREPAPPLAPASTNASLAPSPSTVPSDVPIAIIGMSARFPGAADLDALWRHLVAVDDLVCEVPPDRWDWRRYYGDPAGGERTLSRWGGFLDDISRFDAEFFGISPREAQVMDPQQRLLLETAWHALEDAGIPPREMRGSRTGVFIGAVGNDYWELQRHRHQPVDGFTVSGFAHAILANRISYLLDLHGPSAALDTACSSSLVAIVRAAAALRNGDCDLALAGGVNVILSPSVHIALSKNGMLSPDGRCRTFDHRANGYVRGEGVALVVLKRLDAALRDGDPIHGVIRAAEENHGGRANHLATPNGKAQAELIAMACERGSIDPRTISYVEAHGTGTALGDPIEVESLKSAFHQLGVPRSIEAPWCGLGSVKANLGHLEAAAGVTGLIKLLLALRHRILPGLAHFEHLNPRIDLKDSPFFIVGKTQPWTSNAGPLRGSVSSFGFGGSNAHVIVEEAPAVPRPASNTAPCHLVCVSARSAAGLERRVADLADWLERLTPDLSELAFTLNSGREAMEHRIAFVVATVQELRDEIGRRRRGEPAQASVDGVRPGSWQPAAARAARRALEVLSAELASSREHVDIYRDTLWALATFFAQGHDIDASALYLERPRRIAVPVYPFAGDRHWVERTADHPFSGVPDLAASARGPGMIFRITLDAADPWIADHCVAGRPIVAGVLSLELLRATVARLGMDGPVRLRDILWRDPVEVREKTEVAVAVTEQGEGYRCELQCGGTTRVSAIVERASGTAVTEPICSRSGEFWSRAEVYRRFAGLGIQYGPCYQGIARLWPAAAEVWAEFDLAAVPSASPGDFGLIPPLVDAALQSFIGTQSGSASQVPFSARSVELLAAMPRHGWIHGVCRGGGYDVVVSDQDGRIACAIRQLVHRPIPGGTDFLYRPYWVEVASGLKPDTAISAGATAVLCGEGSRDLADAIAAACSGSRVHCIGHTQIEIDTAVVQLGTINRLIVVPDIADIPAAQCEPSLLDHAEDRGPLAILRLVRSLRRYHSRQQPSIRIVTQDVHLGGEAARPAGATVLGMVEAMAKELPKWSVSAVDLSTCDLNTLDSRAHAIRTVLAEPAAPLEKVYGKTRLVRRIDRLHLPRPEQSPFRRDGVYLIVGGAGGIGSALACHMAARAGARCVLVGRQAQPPTLAATLDRIAAAGGQALYLAADASDLDAMRDVVRQTLDRFGALHGVVHSAMVLADRALASMDESTFRQVLLSKVQGLAATYLAVREHSLDFFLGFSSAQSLLFNPGQVNYAAACAFQDAFTQAVDRPDFPTRVINWGFWGEIGAVASEDYRRHMERLGVRSIGQSEGMDVIERVLAASERQVLAIKLAPDAQRSQITVTPQQAAQTDFDTIALVDFELKDIA